jgi:hypothetical protein
MGHFEIFENFRSNDSFNQFLPRNVNKIVLKKKYDGTLFWVPDLR